MKVEHTSLHGRDHLGFWCGVCRGRLNAFKFEDLRYSMKVRSSTPQMPFLYQIRPLVQKFYQSGFKYAASLVNIRRWL